MNQLKLTITDILHKTAALLKREDLTDEQRLQALNNLRAVIKLVNNV